MRLRLSFVLFLFLSVACSDQNSAEVAKNEPALASYLNDYNKTERYITMRDGVRLFTTIYTPKDTSKTYPVLLKRTPYSAQPYGADTMPRRLSHNEQLAESGYIFVVQDMRGRWMSEGTFENTKPPYSFDDSTATDEVTDSWDTFEWMLDSLPHYNGKAGIYGNSYLGWTSLVAATSNHPSLKAAMPMAPVTDFYFEDFNRYGLFSLSYLPVISVFGTPRPEPVDTAWWVDKKDSYGMDSTGRSTDYYDFFLNRLTLNNYGDILDSTDFFWKNIKAHPNQDEFRKKRDWIQYLDKVTCPIMVVGGWSDEQNLYGIINSYKKLEKTNPKAQFVMEPWSHGHPVRKDSAYYLGDVFYGNDLSENFMADIEFNYFEHYLKGNGSAPDFRVRLFDTGKNEWEEFDKYPYETGKPALVLNLEDGELVDFDATRQNPNFATYYADPFHPVPYVEGDEFHRMPPKAYFTADQRFASKRPDVLTYQTQILEGDVTVLGEVKALIDFATNRTAADIYVKLIDVYPIDREVKETDPEGVKMNGYQQLVRVGYIRGRYRDGFEKGIPFEQNKKTLVNVPLLDVFHTFKKGHKIMIQIQSSMFPLFDLNPQNYVEDIYNAKRTDFTPAMHKVFTTSRIVLPIK